MEWLNRRLLVSPISYALCLSEASFYKELQRLKIPPGDWGEFLILSATTHFFKTQKNEFIAIVTIGDRKRIPIIETYALLVHEAVHIWQEICEKMYERNPSIEFEAYSIQAISQDLMDSYARQTKRK